MTELPTDLPLYIGPYGRIERIPYPTDIDNLPPHQRAALESSLGLWLITAPGYHPLWSQYALCVINLADHPDLPPAHRKFDGATHELLVLAINPEHQQSVQTMREHCRKGTLPYLTPVNIAEQFECTDEEAVAVAWLAAWGVINGLLTPETSDAPSTVRAMWLASCTKTLAHLRGEEHAS